MISKGDVLSGGRLVARALKREGVEQIFTLSGGHIMPIYYGCRAEGIEVIDFRHESSAAFAADAYARVTGKPGVLVTTAGPGVTNTVTGMAESLTQGTPLVHIGGAATLEARDTGEEQDLHTLRIMSTVSKWAREAHQTRRIPEYVSTAFRHATGVAPGPVYLEIAIDVLAAEVDRAQVRFPELCRTDAQPFGDPSLVEEAAELLAEAERPVIVIGSGARFSAAYGEAIPELADYLKSPVSVQMLCRGLFADEETNPLFCLAGAEARADVVLLLNVTNDFLVNRCRPPIFAQDARLIQVHPNPTQIGYNAPAAVGIVGGAGAVARELLEAVQARRKPRADTAWVEEAAAVVDGIDSYRDQGSNSDAVPIHPGRCAYEVSRFLNQYGRDWTVVMDGGDAAEWAQGAVVARRPGQLLMYGPLGTLGTGAGFAVGAWAANGKPVLYYTGDGSFGFYPMAFDTYCRHGVPVVCVISNDSAWGMIKHLEEGMRPDEVSQGHVGVELPHMRAYERIVEMWDGYGERVTQPEEIVPALQRAAASGKPSIINVETDKVHPSPYTVGFLEGLDIQ